MGPGYGADGSLADDTQARIGRQFSPVPECVRRVETRVNGACGNQADLSIKPATPEAKDEQGRAIPSEAQQTQMDEWRRDLSGFWDRVQLWGGVDITKPTGVRGVVAYASAHASGSACIRAFFNPASLTESAADGTRRIPPQPDRRTALRHIEIVAPEPDRCAVYTDPDTHQRTGVFLYTDISDKRCAELWYAVSESGKQQTALRVLTEGTKAADIRLFPWGGWLPIVQADIGCLLTEPVLRLQAAIDSSVTGGNRLAEAHGYGARTEINAAETGDWRTQPPPGIEVPTKKTLPDGTTVYFWPSDPNLGNGVIRGLRGFPYTTGIDEENRKESLGITTPAVHYHEPSDPEAIIKWVDALITLLRHSCHQGHIRSGLLGSTAEASGEAYEQARAEFESDVKSVAEVVDMMVAHFLVVVTLMADWLAGAEEPTFVEEWEVAVQSHPSAGPVSMARETSTLALVDGGLISQDEGTARVGIQDVQGERERINASPSTALKLVTERATAAKALIDAGADRTAAWIAAGFDEERAAKLARSDGPPFQQQ